MTNNKVIDFKKKIEPCQKAVLCCPIKKLLKRYPENIAPILKKKSGLNIINGDSCVSLIDIFLLLYGPWKVFKNNLHEYIEVKNAVKIPIVAA